MVEDDVERWIGGNEERLHAFLRDLLTCPAPSWPPSDGANAQERLADELTALGFEVLPSQTNFLLVRPPRFGAERWLKKLRRRKILVRWFKSAEVREYLRITVGADAEVDALLKAVRSILLAR